MAIDNSFLIIGHRGAAAHCIENTISSFEKAVNKYGSNALELDICMTRDENLVLWHDWEPDSIVAIIRQNGHEPGVKYRPFPPTNEKRRPIHELTLNDFRHHYGYSKKRGKRKKLDTPIPTLKDFFYWAREQKKMEAVFLDVKLPLECKNLIPVFMKKMRNLLQAFKPAYQVIILTKEEEILFRMKREASQFNYSFDLELPIGIVIDPQPFSSIQKAIQLENDYASIGRPILQLSPWTTYRMIVENDIELREKYDFESTRSFKKLICWTINKRREMRCLITMGTNGVITDRPGRLHSVVRKLKRGPLLKRISRGIGQRIRKR